MRGISGILEGFDNPSNVGVNGNDAGVSGMRVEGNTLELIDKVLGCEEVEGIYEDHSTLTVSFSFQRANRRRRGCNEMRYD
jgi:hypothetical protein